MKNVILISAFLFSFNSYTQALTVVPTAKIAEQLADVVLPSIYGKQVLEQKPYKISDKGDYWYIDGQLPKKYVLGGSIHCEIRKSDGSFKNIFHGK